jgi:hypothetical protein
MNLAQGAGAPSRRMSLSPIPQNTRDPFQFAGETAGGAAPSRRMSLSPVPMNTLDPSQYATESYKGGASAPLALRPKSLSGLSKSSMDILASRNSNRRSSIDLVIMSRRMSVKDSMNKLRLPKEENRRIVLSEEQKQGAPIYAISILSRLIHDVVQYRNERSLSTL